MTVLHTYTSTWNDLYMIRHYVRHWSQYAAKMFVYDDDSTDGTREFLESCAPLVEIKSPGFHGIDEIKLQEMRDREYKIHSRGIADWVLIGDSDEFHYHPRMLEALTQKRKQGICAVVSHGWQMFAQKPPADDVLMTAVIKEGIEDWCYNRVIFDPDLNVSIGIGHHAFIITDGPALSFTKRGFHYLPAQTEEAQERFKIDQDDREFKMLHYKYLGEDHIKERHARCWPRLSARNKVQGWGHHSAPDWGGAYSVEWYKKQLKNKIKCID